MVKLIDFKRYLHGPKAAGLKIVLKGDDEKSISYQVLKLFKGEVTRDISSTSIVDTRQLKEELSTKIPLYISIDGKGVLHKKVPMQQDHQELVGKILPGASMEDFYYQVVDSKDNYKIVSIIRKEAVDELLRELHDKGYMILGVFIGPFVLHDILNLFGVEQIYTCGYLIETDGKFITGFQNALDNEVDYNLDDEKINSNLLVPFATAIVHFNPSSSLFTSIEEDGIDTREFRYRKMLEFTGIFGLTALFLILLINLIIYFNRLDEISAYQTRLNINMDLIKKVESLENELVLRRELFENSVIDKDIWLSYVADKLAMKVPRDLSLDAMLLNPKRADIHLTKPLDFINKRVVVSGSTKNSIILNRYINDIKKEKWIKKINVISFKQDNMNQKGSFKISIEY